MARCNKVLSQIVRIFPRHEFQALVNKYHTGQKFRSFSRWAQFVALLTAQLSGRDSLRDIVENMSVLASKLYHLGIKPFRRATLSRANEQQPQDVRGTISPLAEPLPVVGPEKQGVQTLRARST